MRQDFLQIALEHHRAGRLRQAEGAYRALLQNDPTNSQASHWLGVLMCQAGRAEEAVPLLERATAAQPDDTAFRHNLGQAYLASGRVADAIEAFQRVLAIEPNRAETLFSAGLARLARKSAGDAEDAVVLLTKAQAAGIDSADVHQNIGVAMLMCGRIDDAIAACKTAIEKRNDYAEAHYHLGVAYRHKGRTADARQCFARAIELQPTYARAIQGLAVLEAETGRLSEAETLLRKAIALQPDSPVAHQSLGMLLQKMGRQNEATFAFIDAVRVSKGNASRPAPASSASEAIADLERKLTPTTEEAALHFRLSKEANIAPPSQVPASSVAGLFDRYADLFDEHLRGKLEYRAPELIVEAVAATKPDRLLDTLDLGCGTGLCGPLLRPLAKTLHGVDLSAGMVEKARERGVYDHLEAADMLEVMRRSPLSFDLLVAADVLMYVGDLAPTFEAATATLRPGGQFAFSVEAGQGDRYQLRKETHRFTHAKSYVQYLAKIYGFEEESSAEITVRKEAGKPVSAYVVVLRWP
jgi:predicted TPR repeat methyltransferase